MQGEAKEKWEELCLKAKTEQDPEKLLVLIKEINDLLDAKFGRLTGKRPSES
jgi:hypothetical protein